MSTLADLRPGDIMFARHVSPRSADLLILAGQTLLGQAGYPHHVGVVTQAAQSITMIDCADQMRQAANALHGPKIVQAMPHGAEEIEISEEHWTPDYIYLRPAYGNAPTYRHGGDFVAACARRYIGTPYSFADYVALAGWHFGIKNGPVRRYVTSSGHQICSQLADQALADAGFHVFDDGRLSQDVTPSALYSRLLELGSEVIKPGG